MMYCVLTTVFAPCLLVFHAFDIKMFNFDVQTELFYSKTMENYISILIRNHETIMEEIRWQNVQNVELTFRS